ncbi:MAG: 2Fe-2S iron-sulfur cluster-binding protein [Pseudomonadales bacterium]
MTAHTITIANGRGQFRCPSGRRLSQIMEFVSLIEYACRRGGCGNCHVKVLSGEYDLGQMSRAHITEEEIADGVVMACMIYPRSDLTILVLEEE